MNLKHISNEVKYYLKTYGFKNTVKKCIKVTGKKVKRIFTGTKVEMVPSESYQKWVKNNTPTKKQLEEQRNYKFEKNPKISIIVPMYNTPLNFFKELVDSLINQTYTNWELCLADGSKERNEKIEKLCSKDKRIVYKFLNDNQGISGNTNEALKLATGDYIALLDHDDLLPIYSLFEYVKLINEHPNAEFIYSDEDKITTLNKPRFEPHFKPDFSIDFLRTNNYICHFSMFKKELMDKLGGFRSKYDGAQDFDIILRMSENVESYANIYHIPKVLYHWRVHAASTAGSGEAKTYAFDSGVLAVQDHLDRVGIKAKVEHGATLGTYKANYEIIGEPKVSIVIPNKDGVDMLKRCINSIKEKSTYDNYEIIVVENNSETEEIQEYYKVIDKEKNIKVITYPKKGFNYSAIINYGVKNAKGEYIVQLNNDTEIITPNWIEEMLGFAQRKDVGAVGARLYFEDNTIQHAGLFVGVDTIAGQPFKGMAKGMHGYFARESSVQDMSAVTAACMMNRKELYEEVGYMNEDLPVSFNDVDFCLKLRQKGYLVVYNPWVELMHYESKTRGYEVSEEKQKRFLKEINTFLGLWKPVLDAGDPYYNKNFSLDKCYDVKED